MLASAALASASLPLREASITRFTAAMSASEVAAVGAIAKGPDVGRASGLKKARVSRIVPRKPDIGLRERGEARFVRIVGSGGGGRFCGSWVAGGVAGIAPPLACQHGSAGRGRGKGTFCASAVADSADSTQAAVNVK